MATLVTPTNLQKIEFDVTNDSRVTIVTGAMPITLTAHNNAATHNGSFKALLDPTLTPGQFRGATATAAFGAISSSVTTGTNTPSSHSWLIDDAQATFDDQAGRVQLVIDVRVATGYPNMMTEAHWLMFQVTTLSKI